MIILDFNGVFIGHLLQQPNPQEDMIRHTILNTLRMYSHKFKKQYGKMVIACDRSSWRRDYFPQYKSKRRDRVNDNKEQFKRVFELLDTIKAEINEFLPYQLVEIDGCEADDVIATLCHQTQEFGQHEDIMIVSADKDFIQLHKYGNIKQYSSMSKQYVTEANPERYIFDHILKGDSSDGIPNILSGDNTFTDGIRQAPMTKIKMDYFWENRDKLQEVMTEEQYRNYKRNLLMISLDEIPSDIQKRIVDNYDAGNKKAPSKTMLLNYLTSNHCRLLVECIDEF